LRDAVLRGMLHQGLLSAVLKIVWRQNLTPAEALPPNILVALCSKAVFQDFAFCKGLL
jgi:hypothetical protein